MSNVKDNNENDCKKKKFDFNEKKENTISSLFEVEGFLCNFGNVLKGVRLYKILKK